MQVSTVVLVPSGSEVRVRPCIGSRMLCQPEPGKVLLFASSMGCHTIIELSLDHQRNNI